MDLGVVIASLATGSLGGALVAGALERRRTIWTAKKDACMEALVLVDARFANLEWEGLDGTASAQEMASIADYRRVHNLLAVTCRDPRVVEAFLRCLGFVESGAVRFSGADIAGLRAAVRRECGMWWRPLKASPNLAYLGAVPGTKELPDSSE